MFVCKRLYKVSMNSKGQKFLIWHKTKVDFKMSNAFLKMRLLRSFFNTVHLSSAAFGRLHYYIKAKTKSTFSMCTQVSRGVKLSQFPSHPLESALYQKGGFFSRYTFKETVFIWCLRVERHKFLVSF